jgi:monoterpene epsilon-lactone hydrolase
MASWQAAALARFIAFKIKRKPTSQDEMQIVRQARQKLGHMPGYVQPAIPADLHIRTPQCCISTAEAMSPVRHEPIAPSP